MSVSIVPVLGVPEIEPGTSLTAILGPLLAALDPPLRATDVLVVAQKIVSKAESRYVDLVDVVPTPRAVELSSVVCKDPRLVEVVLGESTDVVRAVRDVLIVRHRLGLVMAQAGVDQSNVPIGNRGERVLLLPIDPQRSAESLRDELNSDFGFSPAVIVSDSFGRPWRMGVVNVAIGAAGIAALWDRRGDSDRSGRPLKITQVGWADAIAAAAGLVMGEADESTPVVVVRGLAPSAAPCGASALIRPAAQDLFR